MGDARLASHPDLFPEQITVVTLTRREQLVLEKLAAGLTLQQTADALVVSYNTIRSQQASVYRKLGAESRLDAIARARQWGLF
jgi:LuxR family maltose regulon positive regulatory protein